MIEIYRDFELITLDPPFTNFKWRRQFSLAGEFQLETFFTPEKMQIFAEGNVIYKRDVDEAALIERRSVIQDIDGNFVLVVSGRMLGSLLDRRVFSHAGQLGLKEFLTRTINYNFLSQAGANRQIPNLHFLPMDFPDSTVTAEFSYQDVYSTVTKILEEHSLGLKVFYNLRDRTYDLKVYAAEETDVVFSREFANIIEQDYTDNTENYKNVVYVEGRYIHNDTLFTGLARREMSIPMPSGGVDVTQNAVNALVENKALRTLSNVINPFSKQYEYLTDWNIGSVVTAKNKELGYMEREIVTEITEFYDETGLNLEVNLGDYKIRG